MQGPLVEPPAPAFCVFRARLRGSQSTSSEGHGGHSRHALLLPPAGGEASRHHGDVREPSGSLRCVKDGKSPSALCWEHEWMTFPLMSSFSHVIIPTDLKSMIFHRLKPPTSQLSRHGADGQRPLPANIWLGQMDAIVICSS